MYDMSGCSSGQRLLYHTVRIYIDLFSIMCGSQTSEPFGWEVPYMKEVMALAFGYEPLDYNHLR